MKTKEFIEKSKKIGFEVEEKGEIIKIVLGSRTIAHVSCVSEFNLVTNYQEFEKIVEHKRKELFELLVAYASVPVAER